uniref:Uncharacterized protein n=1 Tax=Lotharella globosa TaxID=91324 RepID=A0A7S4DM40_9EUKA
MGCAASVKTVPVDQYEVSETKVFKALAKGNREGDGEEADFSRVTTKTNSLEIGDGVSRTVTVVWRLCTRVPMPVHVHNDDTCSPHAYSLLQGRAAFSTLLTMSQYSDLRI